MRDELLGYYERELLFLRRMGAEFARKYPKVASRLQLDEEQTEDPHVERMIEAFALLAGRIGLKIEDELPEITESFLNVIYPHYLAPIPSVAIANFSYGSPNDKITSIQKVERGSALVSKPIDGTPCRFRTCFETELVPLEIISAALESNAPTDARGKWANAQVRLSLRTFGDSNLAELKNGITQKPLEKLRFYLNGDPQIVFPLYELIFNQAEKVELRAKDTPITSSTMSMTMNKINLKIPDPIFLPPDSLKQVGFEEDEGLLPYSARSFAGYRLLTEYFAFPYKFLFFEVSGIDLAAQKKFGSYFDIIIHLKEVTPFRAPITEDTFRLNCSPIVNLFSQTAEPIYLSQKKFEYHVIPDVHRQTRTEIYSIEDVITTNPRTNETRKFQPFYSLRHTYGDKVEKVFWYTTRRQSQRADDEGTEIYLNLVDMGFNPRVPATEVIHLKTTCTNRDLPAKLPFGGRDSDFEIEGTALLSRVKCLTKPTATIRPPLQRGAQWRLISHLNLNHLSLVNSKNSSPEALQEILSLYNYSDFSGTRNQIMGITTVESRRVVRQIGQKIGAGFVRGLETTVEFDEEQFVGSGLFLFASVLERFFALYASLNSFNQLTIKTKQRESIVKTWKPRAGEQILL